MEMWIPVAETWRIPTLVVFVAMLVMMILDILTGLAVAWSENGVSSTISRRGMVRKVLMILLVGATGLAKLVLIQLQPEILILPIIAMSAGFFAASEFISVMEHAAILGISNPFTRRLAQDLSSAVDGEVSERQTEAVNKPLL